MASKANLKVENNSHFDEFNSLSKREMSTTMVFVRLITSLLRDKKIGKNIVPIVPDEARTFGMMVLDNLEFIAEKVKNISLKMLTKQVYRESKE